MRFVIGADEFDPILDVVAAELHNGGHEVEIIGATRESPAPWGQVAIAIGKKVADRQADQGIVCCYTGTGVTIAANKIAGVRAALCVDAETARGARQWNDANVLALSLRLTSPAVAREIVRSWTTTPYAGSEGASLDAIRDAEHSKS